MASRMLRKRNEFWEDPRPLTAADVGHGNYKMVSYCAILKLSLDQVWDCSGKKPLMMEASPLD